MVAEVEVDRASGAVRVTRAVSAVDAGQTVNPDGVVNQIEGGIIQSASWTLKEALKFDRAGVKTRAGRTIRSCGSAKCPRSRSR